MKFYHLLWRSFFYLPRWLHGGCIDFQMNNWESLLNCPFQISPASSLIHFTSLPLVFLPPWSTSSPYRPISSLLTYSSSTLFPPLLTFPLPSIPLSHLSFLPSPLLLCAADVDPVLWRVVQEGMGCSHGWPAGLCVSSVSKTRCCFRVLLGAVSLSLSLSQLLHPPHTHTPTHTPSLSLCLRLSASFSVSFRSPSWLISTVHLNSNTQLISILKSTWGSLLRLNRWLS